MEKECVMCEKDLERYHYYCIDGQDIPQIAFEDTKEYKNTIITDCNFIRMQYVEYNFIDCNGCYHFLIKECDNESLVGKYIRFADITPARGIYHSNKYNKEKPISLDVIHEIVDGVNEGVNEEVKVDEELRKKVDAIGEQLDMFKMPSVDEIAEAVIAKQKKSKKEEKQDDLLASIMDAMAKTISGIKADELLESLYPKIDKRIHERYGFLPEVHEIKVGEWKKDIVGTTHEKFDEILSIVNASLPVYLYGPAGTGKNVICKQVAEALNLPFYFTNAVTQEYKLTGFIDAGGNFHETQFYQAFKDGGLFFLDEMDASIPEVLIILNAAIANGYFDFPIGRIEANPDFRVIAAGNTEGTGADNNYTGRFCLDRASLDRFCSIKIDYSPKIERLMASDKQELLDFVKEFRRMSKKQGIDCLFSYRSIDRINKLEDIIDDLQEVLKISLLRGFDIDDINIMKSGFNEDMKNNKYINCIMNWKGGK